MKLLCVFEYNEKYPNFSLTAIDSKRTAYSGSMTISNLEISQYCDIFYVADGEDKQKFDKSGLYIEDFLPMLTSGFSPKPNSVDFAPSVIKELLLWADAKRVWVYKSTRMTGPDRLKFDEFYKKLEWKNPNE